MSDEIMETETETETVAIQSQDKTFTQDELDRIVADRIAREQRKFEKKLSGIDLDDARDLMQKREDADLERQKERGEFDNILKKTVEKKDLEISAYKSKLQQTLVDGALLSAASQNNAVNPDQVSTLLKGYTRLSDDGSVEVLDAHGVPRYNDSGDLLSVNDMVTEFLTGNPHFVRASQGGTGSQGKTGGINDMLGKVKSREEFEQLTPQKRSEFIRSGGTLQ
jgi:hypothetical protein|tara:strand:- start:1341 stop:2009 length:669 start_codon:yes stop_codon:yes gene_type:complete